MSFVTDQRNISAGKGYTVGLFGFLATFPGLFASGSYYVFIVLVAVAVPIASYLLKHMGLSGLVPKLGFSSFILCSGVFVSIAATPAAVLPLLVFWFLLGVFVRIYIWPSAIVHLEKTGGSIW